MSGRVLVVDDVATNRIVMKAKLGAAFYEVLQASGAEEALALAVREAPDLILLEAGLSDTQGEGRGFDLCRALKSNPAAAAIPILMTAAEIAPGGRLAALNAGAEDLLLRPLADVTLLARLRSLLRSRDSERELRLREGTCRELGFAEPEFGFEAPQRIAIVGEQSEEAADWIKTLSPLLPGHRLAALTWSAMSAGSGTRHVPDLYVIAPTPAHRSEGLQLLSQIRSSAETRYAGIILMIDSADHQGAAMALDLGANDIMSLPFDAEELRLRITTQLHRKRQSDQLRASVRDGLRLAVIDPLTGLYNRRYATHHLARIASEAEASGRSFAVMMVDIDRFKDVNDSYGHAAGDEVLAAVARRLRDNLRGVDLVARIGGEEFLAVLPDCDGAEAQIAAERLRRNVASAPVPLKAGAGSVRVTVSIGVTLGCRSGVEIEAVMRDADTALYRSKSSGRNLVTVGQSAA